MLYARIVSLWPDFLEQQPEVFEICHEAGHIPMMLPECHPEFNYIELYSGVSKAKLQPTLESEQANNKKFSNLIEYLRHIFNEISF